MEGVRNKQVLFRGFITGAPKETDMEFRVGTAKLRIPDGFRGVLVKNLYLSCDPYMRGRMREVYNSYIPPFSPGSVSTIKQSLRPDFLACDRYFRYGLSPPCFLNLFLVFFLHLFHFFLNPDLICDPWMS